MHSLFGLMLFALFTFSSATQLDIDSCINNNHVICDMKNGSQACCPIKDGVCCLDSDFCCPKSIIY